MNIMTRQILSALGVALVGSPYCCRRLCFSSFPFWMIGASSGIQEGHESPIHYFFTKYGLRDSLTIRNPFRHVLESDV